MWLIISLGNFSVPHEFWMHLDLQSFAKAMGHGWHYGIEFCHTVNKIRMIGLILKGWLHGKVSKRVISLIVKSGWITIATSSSSSSSSQWSLLTIISGSVGLRPALRIAQSKLWVSRWNSYHLQFLMQLSVRFIKSEAPVSWACNVSIIYCSFVHKKMLLFLTLVGIVLLWFQSKWSKAALKKGFSSSSSSSSSSILSVLFSSEFMTTYKSEQLVYCCHSCSVARTELLPELPILQSRAAIWPSQNQRKAKLSIV